jgi:putative FmdB family regulatory protein
MPVYEYRCEHCGTKFRELIGMVAGADTVRCPKCDRPDAQRLVSRFARFRGEDERLDAIADRLETMGEPESAGEMREIVRELGKAMDEDMADEMEELFEEDLNDGGTESATEDA